VCITHTGDFMLSKTLVVTSLVCTVFFTQLTTVLQISAQDNSQVYRLSPAQVKKVQENLKKQVQQPQQVVNQTQRPLKRILITGFRPYRHYKTNPSGDFAISMHGKVIGDYQIIAARFPVEIGQIDKYLPQIIASVKPDFVISLGNGIPNITTIETVARNKVQDREAKGSAKFTEKPIEVGAVMEIPSTLEPQIDQIVSPIRASKASLPTSEPQVKESSDAGNDACNYIFYKTSLLVGGKALFVHVPSQNDMTDEAYKAKNYPFLTNTITRVIQSIPQ
jgi:pyroglutamyl-peptidase